MEITQATLEDLDSIVKMGGAFFAEAAWEAPLVWDDKQAEEPLKDLIENEDAIMLIARKESEIIGMVGGLVYPVWYNPSILMGQEFFWYVKPEHRCGVGARLLTELEKEAKEKGAVIFEMMSMESMPSLDGFYNRFGYKSSEKTFIKRL
jgi:GNAT superfamily N-acetyltransferase